VFTALGSRTVGWEESLSVPAAPTGLVWATVTASPNALGAVLRMLFKIPSVWMTVATDDAEIRFRLPLGEAGAGFLLSPLVWNRVEFAALTSPGLVPPRARRSIRTIRFDTPGRLFYHRNIGIAFSSLSVSPQVRPPRISPEIEALLDLNAGSLGRRGVSRLMPDEKGRLSLHTDRASRHGINLRAGTYRVSGRFWLGFNGGDGTLFSLRRLLGRAEDTVWHRVLNPAANRRDEGPQRLIATVTFPRAGTLVFATGPTPDGKRDDGWGFWSEIRIQPAVTGTR
jgi:hypothetical protein